MTQKEVFLLLLVVAAAIAAAFSFRVAVLAGELHDPRFADRFERARAALPVLGAVRVRSSDPHAAHVLAVNSRGEIERVVDPVRAERVFRYGRLLYASPRQVRAIRDALKRGEYPTDIPPAPDIARFFRDRRGPYSCDAILGIPGGLRLIRDSVPDARLSGEPVVVAREREAARDLPRALVLALLLAGGWAAFRAPQGEFERRLLAALLPLALLGALDWGIDSWTVLALAIASAAPHGPPLLAGALCLLFPSQVLRRIGVVFLLAGLARWRRPDFRPRASRRPAVALLALLMALGCALAWSYRPASRIPESLRGSPAAALVAPDALRATADDLRARGLTTVVGDEELLPPEHDVVTRRLHREVFQLATYLAYKEPRFEQVRLAAAEEQLYVPLDLRAQLFAADGRRALWAQEEGLIEHEEFTSSELYRLRGEAGLRRDGKLAALLLFLLAGAGLVATRGRRAVAPLLIRFGAVAVGGWVLVLAERGALPVSAEAAFPLLVLASLAPSGVVVLALAGAAVAMPSALLWPSIVLALVAGCAWLTRRRPRTRSLSRPSPPRPAPPPAPPDRPLP